MKTNELPEPVASHIGMLLPSERRFLFDFSKNNFKGEGVIIDAGTFLGASTVALAEGLALNGREIRGRPIRSYDLARCDVATAKVMTYYFPQEPWADGTSFAAVLARLLEPYKSLVDFTAGDIRTTLQCIEEPVELAFLDCSKLPSINLHLTKTIFPKLIPGHSVVVQQDFFHEWLPWIHVTMGSLRSYFRFIGSAGPSAFFLCTKRVPDDVASTDYWTNSANGIAMFDAAVPTDGLSPGEKYLLSLARLCALRWYEGVQSVERAGAKIVKPPRDLLEYDLPAVETMVGNLRSENFDALYRS